jgi:hypothetical protein
MGPFNDPANVSFDITWTAVRKMRHLRPDLTDNSVGNQLTLANDFAGEFRLATTKASLSGTNQVTSFTFHSVDATLADVFAEMGTERNGFFVR